MKIAVVGKGGSGKTTTAAVLSRTLGRRGSGVVALDCDTNPNLGISLGMGEDTTERLVAMRQALDEGSEAHAPGWADLLDRFGADGPDGVRMAVVSRIDNPDPGCPCCGLSPERLLQAVDDERIIVADFEGGIGTMTRLAEGVVDAVVLVVEPTPKSLEVGRRAVELAGQRACNRLVLVGNRIRDGADADAVRAAFPGMELVLVPDDPAVVEADRLGRSPVDHAPGGTAVTALAGLTDRLVPARA